MEDGYAAEALIAGTYALHDLSLLPLTGGVLDQIDKLLDDLGSLVTNIKATQGGETMQA